MYVVSAESQSSFSQKGGKKIECEKKASVCSGPNVQGNIERKWRCTVHGANFVSFCFSYANDRLPRTMYDRVIAV